MKKPIYFIWWHFPHFTDECICRVNSETNARMICDALNKAACKDLAEEYYIMLRGERI